MLDQIKEFINPSKNPDLTQAYEFQRKNIPTLWLLGKTGAGKSSFIQALTNLSSIEIGNGFAPCTMTASVYAFPQDKAIMRFLDTRGLGEADYDPSADLAQIGQSGHALIVLMKADDPEQSSVIAALKKINKKDKIKQLFIVHTAVLVSNEADRNRQIRFNEQQVEAVWSKPVTSVAVDFHTSDGSIYNYDTLIEKLSALLPIIGMIGSKKEQATVEEANFVLIESEVLWYSGIAAASDLVPAVGLVSVPAVQAKMLHSIANQFGIAWNSNAFSELIGALGGSFALQYGVKLGARQLIKLIPVYGQTIGAVTAAAISFSTTYGLGRAACFYFYYKSKGEQVSELEMQKVYKDSLIKGRNASGYDKD